MASRRRVRRVSRALAWAVATVSALAACGHDLGAWLAGAGMELRWRQG